MVESTYKDASDKPVMSLSRYVAEVLTEPILLALAVIILYNHFKSIWDTSPNFATFWSKIAEHTGANMLVAFGFLAVLAIWATVKALRITREFRMHKELEELLTANSEGLKENIKQISEGIRQNSKGIKQSSEDIKQMSEGIRQMAESIKKLAEDMGKDKENKQGDSPTQSVSQDGN